MNTLLSNVNNIYSPYTAANRIAGTGSDGNTGNGGVPFSSVFTDAIRNYEELNTEKLEDNYKLAVGDIDDIGAIMASAEKAETALYLLVNLRNKLLDSYSEIMRMNM